MPIIIQTHALTKTYHMGDVEVHALRGIDLTIHQGDYFAIMGASGSGKSTLMNLIGCLDHSTSGDYYLDGVNVNELDRDYYADVRNQKIGFVFQGFNLLARSSALENVELPLFYNRKHHIKNPQKKALEILGRVGLSDRVNYEPNRLSGGQQQRVAIARALINDPKIILADEPTGNLDSVTSIEIMELFQELNEQGMTIVIVTHEHDISQYAKRVVTMRDGMIMSNIPVEHQRNAHEDLKTLRSAAAPANV